jgi:serine/threonine protein kinase
MDDFPDETVGSIEPRGPGGPGGSTGPGPERDEARLAGLIADYLDRLNAGEDLDPATVIAEHPEDGPRILAALEEFVRLEPSAGDGPALGVIGDYTLRRRIGRGGMGVVYEAWQGSLERRVALKVLPAGIAAETRTYSRFLREAQIAAKLNHPQIVPVYGFGVESSTPYYTMELIEGETLAGLLARLRAAKGKDEARRSILRDLPGLSNAGAAEDADLPLETEAQIGTPPMSRRSLLRSGDLDLEHCARLAKAFAGVAEGLQHAHSRGITHRDIKPSNLIFDPGGRLRILDFGLARLEGQESLTQSGDLMGTPLYMSPEQAMAKRITIDHRTDIYSLGATFYEALTLRPPFEGKDHRDTLSQILFRDPDPPRRANPRVPQDLETIILKCLRKDPGDRYGTAEALGQDLRRFARGDAIEARPQSRWERSGRRLWRARWRLGSGLLVAMVLSLATWQLIAARENARGARGREYDAKVLRSALRLEVASLSQKSKAGEAVISLPEIFRGSPRAADSEPAVLALRGLDEAAALLPERLEAHYHCLRLCRWLITDGSDSGTSYGVKTEIKYAVRAVRGP